MLAFGSLMISLFTALLALPAFAQQQDQAQAEGRAALEAARAAMKPGPADIALDGHARIKLPHGYVFVPIQESQRLLQAMGNRPGAGLLGTIFPSADAPWFVVINFHDSGYVKDDDAKDWKADELLQSIKQGTEAANDERRKQGIPEIEVSGWVEQPKYDSVTHRLVWSASIREKGASANAPQGVNYNTYALGREGYISLNLVTELATIERDKSAAHELLGALEYNEGKRYADFNSSTDRVAEYGLAALVGGIAAKKLGLFAVVAAFLIKLWKWKIGLIALAAFGALFGVLLTKLLKRRRAPNSPPPAS